MKLYYHKTDGGAEYLTDTFIKWEDIHNGEVIRSGKEGTINDKTKYIVRIDGNIEEDVELTVKGKNKLVDDAYILANYITTSGLEDELNDCLQCKEENNGYSELDNVIKVLKKAIEINTV